MEPALAHWLVAQRGAIEREAARAAGALDPASPEAEALRRFRSYVLLALARGSAEPALEGLRVSVRRAAAALDAWIQAAGSVAGSDAAKIVEPLAALRAPFIAALGAAAPARRAGGPPTPSARRAVSAAIDRVADVFLAADVDSGAIADCNPAACALLGLSRPELLARDLLSCAPELARATWSLLLEAMAEGGEPRRAHAALVDASGAAAPLDVRVTRSAVRDRTLALFVARPLG